MKEKVLVPGLNTIFYTNKGRRNIDEFISLFEGKDNITVVKLDKENFTYDNISREAVENADKGIIVVYLVE